VRDLGGGVGSPATAGAATTAREAPDLLALAPSVVGTFSNPLIPGFALVVNLYAPTRSRDS